MKSRGTPNLLAFQASRASRAAGTTVDYLALADQVKSGYSAAPVDRRLDPIRTPGLRGVGSPSRRRPNIGIARHSSFARTMPLPPYPLRVITEEIEPGVRRAVAADLAALRSVVKHYAWCWHLDAHQDAQALSERITELLARLRGAGAHVRVGALH